MTAFLVPMDTPGVTRRARDESLGVRGLGCMDLEFDIAVGVDQVLGPVDQGYIAATIDTGRGLGLRGASAHFDVLGGPARLWTFLSGLRDRQAHTLVAALDDGRPIVVGADLNTWADATGERAVATLRAAWPEAELQRLQSTFRFGLRLDYFFFRLGDGWRGEWRVVESSFGSDHRPLVSRLICR